ncbi:hypothetical protein ACVIYH_005046 [Bradyrhizobium diazoefficiens]
MAWGCSATEVDWRAHGFAGAQLGYLFNGAGYFHQAHRAVDDCHALLEVLDFALPTTGAPALAALLQNARKPTVRVWAEQSPFELKDSLKKRGYRWSDGSDGRPKSWYVDVGESAVEDELAFLRAEIYLRDVEPRLQTLTASTCFSCRIGRRAWRHRPRRFSTFLRPFPTFLTAFLTAEAERPVFLAS